MTFRTITACMTGGDRYTPALHAAAAIADENAAHLSVLCLGVDRTNPGAYYAGAEALILQTNIDLARNEALEAEDTCKKVLANQAIRWDTQTITAQMGTLGQVIGDRSELSDLVVLPKPYGEDAGSEDIVILEAALFQTRVPVLVLPDGLRDWTPPKRVVIAWNQNPGALAAVRASVDILRKAESVEIAVVDPAHHAADRSDPGGALAQMLSRHGIHASISVLARTVPKTSEVLARHCRDRDADLLIMGAYGHSRLRELFLGGTTRNMLEDATLPVIMAH